MSGNPSGSAAQRLHERAQQIDRDFRAIRQALQRPAEAEFARGELTGAQRAIMQVVVASEGPSLKELSRQAGLAHSTVSGIVDRLEKRGLLIRRPDVKDGRFSRIFPSAEVTAFMRDRLPALTINPLVDALSRAKPAERAIIVEGLSALRRLLEQHPG